MDVPLHTQKNCDQEFDRLASRSNIVWTDECQGPRVKSVTRTVVLQVPFDEQEVVGDRKIVLWRVTLRAILLSR